MLLNDTAIVLVIMMKSFIWDPCSAEDEIPRRGDSSGSPRRKNLLIHWNREKENFLGGPRRNDGDKTKIKAGGKTYLDPVIIKLDNVMAKYEMKKGHLEEIYMGVVGCGVSRCEKFKNLIPENQRLRRLHCFKKKKHGFKKMVLDLLTDFHRGVQRVEKSLQILINFERWPQLANRSRRKLLEELKIDIKMLSVELETVMSNKRLNFHRDSQVSIWSQFQKPENQTHLMIYEWRIIQASKRFLRDWQKNFKKIMRCWKRRRQENRGKLPQEQKSLNKSETAKD